MGATPGARTPGEQATTEQTVGETGVAIDSTGATDLGGVVADQSEVHAVRVESDAQDFDFNVEAEGADLFGSEQSPASGEETFVPDQNAVTAGTGAVQFTVDVSAASGSTGATATFQVLTEYRRD